LRPQRIALSGATGFIGSHLVASLSARGDLVTPVKRPFDRAALTSTFAGVDVVVHLAGLVSAVRPKDFHVANVEATRVVAEATRDAGARLIHISSLAAAGPAPASAPRSEDDEPRPINAYGRSKLEGERVVKGMRDLQWTILRPGVVYGPGDRAMLPLFSYAIRGLLPLVGEAAAYTFVYIADAVRTVVAAIDRQQSGTVVFVGHSTPVTARELLEGVRDTMGSSARLVRVPRALVRIGAVFGDLTGHLTGRPAAINSRRYAEIYSPGFVCRVDRMRDCLGVVATTNLKDGLAQTAAWYTQHGWI
jgi:nucleoside-diphosphate-sugar epimerase